MLYYCNDPFICFNHTNLRIAQFAQQLAALLLKTLRYDYISVPILRIDFRINC